MPSTVLGTSNTAAKEGTSFLFCLCLSGGSSKEIITYLQRGEGESQILKRISRRLKQGDTIASAKRALQTGPPEKAACRKCAPE